MTQLTKEAKPQVIAFDMPHDRACLWALLTELDQMKKWYFEILPNFKAEVGFRTQFLITNEGRAFTHQWKVTEVVYLTKLSYEWTFAEYPGRSTSIFEIEDKDDGTTRLVITNVIDESFPADIPEFTEESGLEGWTWFMDRLAKV